MHFMAPLVQWRRTRARSSAWAVGVHRFRKAKRVWGGPQQPKHCHPGLERLSACIQPLSGSERNYTRTHVSRETSLQSHNLV